MTNEEIAKKLEQIWDEKLAVDTRSIMFATGRGGAMMQAKMLHESAQEGLLGRKLTDAEKKVISDKIEVQVWEDGTYQTNKLGLLEYKGLFDKNHKDGIFGAVVRGLYYIECWFDGERKAYKIVDEEEYERLKTEDIGDISMYFGLGATGETTD